MEPLSITLSEASGVPYYRQVVDQIARLIRSGKLLPGARLPSVRELSRQLLVSLITIRRSYAELEGAGLIDRRQGQGTFVADEVKAASHHQARAEAKRHFDEAVNRARQLGFEDPQIRELFEALLKEGEQR